MPVGLPWVNTHNMGIAILDASGFPLRRRIGFLPAWDKERERKAVELVSAVGFLSIETDRESDVGDRNEP